MKRLLDNRLIRAITHKLSLLFALLYITIYAGEPDLWSAIFYLFMAYVVSMGIGGLGFLINDFFDREKDSIARKENIFLMLRNGQLALVIMLIVCAAFLPWLVFPFNKISLVLLLVELLLFALYSMEPFRLKEKGLWGVVLDSLYAHVVPAMFAIYTFSLMYSKTFFTGPFGETYALLFLWAFLTGVRNILVHQLDDRENDAVSNTRTFVGRFGAGRITKWILYGLQPLEFAAFIGVLVTFPHAPVLVAVYFVFIALYSLKRRQKIMSSGEGKTQYLIRFINDQWLNEFYEKWLGLLLLTCMGFQEPMFWNLIPLHLLLFFPIYYDTFRR